jgi:hypothetical protein
MIGGAFCSESLAFIKLEIYSVTARRSSSVLSRRRPLTARAICSLETTAPRENREEESMKTKARAAARFGA